MLKYSANHYDDFLRLRISASLWLVILYGIRHLFFVGAMQFMPFEVASVDWLNIQTNLLFMLTDIPAAAVLLATGHRLPEASFVMRWIWSKGKFILTSSYILCLCVFIYLNKSLFQLSDLNDLILAASVVIPDVLIISFILKSALINDIFSDFPSPLKPVTPKTAKIN